MWMEDYGVGVNKAETTTVRLHEKTELPAPGTPDAYADAESSHVYTVIEHIIRRPLNKGRNH